MALRDQSVPFSRCTIFVAGNTKEKESTARPRACRQQRILALWKTLGHCVSPRGDTAKTLLSLSLSLSVLQESRRKTNASRNAERELVAHGDTDNSVPDGRLTVASRAVSLQLTSDRRKVASGKSGVLRSSCLRIDSIEISFKPRPHHSPCVTSRSRRPVSQTQNYSTIWRHPTNVNLWRPLKYMCDVQTCSSRRLTCCNLRSLKKKIEGDII